MKKDKLLAALIAALAAGIVSAATVTIDTTQPGRKQIIDGFGAHQGDSAVTSQAWWQQLFYDDMKCTIYRVDITPRFKSPYSDWTYNSPWFHNNPALPGPENNNCRTYTDANTYTHTTALYGRETPIAVMGPDINDNITRCLDFNDTDPAITVGLAKKSELGDFKLCGSMWSCAPWVKLSSGHWYDSGYFWPGPLPGTMWPFVWAGNFAGGKLDVSNAPVALFDDSAFGGTGPTSALTQFARCTAAYLRGLQNKYGIKFYAVSIQNELTFEEFYNSCNYQLSSQYIAALKAARAELDKYNDLKDIKIIGPEDLMGGDIWGIWQYGGGSDTTHKNLQFLQNIGNDPEAAAALAMFCIHGYAADGVSSSGANPVLWNWWANGWVNTPNSSIPSNVHGFTYYNKNSWMTETSGEDSVWLSPAEPNFPNNGGWSIALKLHQALSAGRESAWTYWTFAEESGGVTTQYALTGQTQQAGSPKYVAAKHFFRYIRPNSYRFATSVSGSTSLLAGSYVHDVDATLTVVLVNTDAGAQSATINVPYYPAGVSSFDCYTSSNGSYWQYSIVNVSAGQASVSVPGYGVVTLVGQGTTAAPPGPPSNPTPEPNITDVSRTDSLTWAAAGGSASHDVYFGTVDPPPFKGNQPSSTYPTYLMEPNTTYYWQVGEKNAYGTTLGPVWSFTTGADIKIRFYSAISTQRGGYGTAVSTWPTIGSGLERVLIVGVGGKDTSASDLNVSSVTCNSIAMTPVAGSAAITASSPYVKTELFYLLDDKMPPGGPPGACTVVVTFAGAVDKRCVGAVCLYNVAQEPPEAVQTNTVSGATSISTNITTTTPGAWVVDVVATGQAGSFTATAPGQVERWDIASDSSDAAEATKLVSTPGLTTMSWQHTVAANLAHSLAAFAPAEPIYALGDLNYDHKVNMLDLDAFADQWLHVGDCSAEPNCADLDDSLRVDFVDLALLAGNFGQ